MDRGLNNLSIYCMWGICPTISQLHLLFHESPAIWSPYLVDESAKQSNLPKNDPSLWFRSHGQGFSIDQGLGDDSKWPAKITKRSLIHNFSNLWPAKMLDHLQFFCSPEEWEFQAARKCLQPAMCLFCEFGLISWIVAIHNLQGP
jgi:hypothetical protein